MRIEDLNLYKNVLNLNSGKYYYKLSKYKLLNKLIYIQNSKWQIYLNNK